jgi:oligopeptide/dipeptide ABC transporter ATP-binding protein
MNMENDPLEVILKTDNLVKNFSLDETEKGKVVHAVNYVSFEISKGETLGLVGESGSGKTTVGRCILKLTDVTSGDIFFRDTNISVASQAEFRKLRPKIQGVFQEPHDSLNPRWTLRKSIQEPLKLWSNTSKKEQMLRTEELALSVGLPSELLDRYPNQIGSGDAQRAAIARSIATDPDLLILDEPTSSLDPLARAQIIDLLIQLQKDSRFAYLFISHDLSSVRYISHRVAVMYLGRIVERGSTDEMFSAPQHPYSRALLGSILIPNPTHEPAFLTLSGEIPSPVDLPRGCFLASRCPFVDEKCIKSYPEPTDLGEEHIVHCFRTEEALEHIRLSSSANLNRMQPLNYEVSTLTR